MSQPTHYFTHGILANLAEALAYTASRGRDDKGHPLPFKPTSFDALKALEIFMGVPCAVFEPETLDE